MNRLSDYARLVRLPNIFTACADVSVGVLTERVLGISSLGLLACSACLYSAGMAWNDFFDRHIDAAERPRRPIPSGAISAKAACCLAIALATAGLALAGSVGTIPFVLAVVLLVVILAYNACLKSTSFGSSAMGGCRFLNVLLGFSATSDSSVDLPTRLAIAAIVGIYIFGVTVFARDEATVSRAGRLRVATGICAAAILGAALVPSSGSSPHPYLCAGLLLLLAYPALNAMAAPSPANVQQFVKAAVFGLVVLDTALATALAGPSGLFVIFWLIPALILGRKLYST
jgi:4-hydroxybenzoate polyprenyltransferase